MAISPLSLARQLLAILEADLPELLLYDNYLHGQHADPYMPPNADDEYKLLVKRAVSNWCPLLVSTPAQALYVDSFRRSVDLTDGDNDSAQRSPEWDHFERSLLGSRQLAIHRGALGYGHSFTLTEKPKGKQTVSRGLSALKTSAMYEDPANDIVPYVALTVIQAPREDAGKPGLARMWDGVNEYRVRFKSMADPKSVKVALVGAHGAPECPVTRFAAAVDLEGRTVGLVGPIIPLQDRINQTVFDLLVAQTYGSTKVRTVSGMAPPIMRDADGKPITDANGNPRAIRMNHNARRFLFAEDKDVKFGSLDETPLGGFIDSIDMSIRHFAAIGQLPPHHLLGQIANLSAEALLAAESALQRKVEEFRKAFGESWERVFRIAAALDGDAASADDFNGQVIWRDMESRSLAQAADALGKMKDQLGIPARGLWARVPGVTKAELDEWDSLVGTEDPSIVMAEALQRASGATQIRTPAASPAEA